MQAALRPTLSDVLETLAAERALEPEQAARAPAALGQLDAALPWYVRGLTGLGGWAAAGFALLFFNFLHPSSDAQLVCGLGALAAAIAARRRFAGPFVTQLCLALALAGEYLVIEGAGATSLRQSWVTLALEVALVWLYPDALMRFVSTGVGAAAAFHLYVDGRSGAQAVDLPFALALGAALALFALRPRLEATRVHAAVAPVAFGLGLFAMGLVLSSLEAWTRFTLGWPAVAAAGALALGAVAVQLRERRAPAEAWALALGGGVLLALLSRAPGLLAAVALLVTAFGRRDAKLLGLSALFLVFFCGYFYYHLGATLLAKSLALTGSGLVLLLARSWALRRFRGA